MVWVPEAYSYDAVSQLGYLAAVTTDIELGAGILPIYSRTPSLIAMTAASLDALSGGRFVLGLGASGPQVIEGWHGVPYHEPIGKTRESIEICRKVWRREVLVHEGPHFSLPLPEGQGTGLGRALKLINKPVREHIPIYVASLGPRNVALTAEVADGWLPVFYFPERAEAVWGTALGDGAAKRDPNLGALEIVAGGAAAVCSMADAEATRADARPAVALYLGGMGAKGRNFYNDLFRAYGYEAEAEEIQDLYIAGEKAAAAAAIPEEFVAAVTLIGDRGFIRDRMDAFKDSGVTRLDIRPVGSDPLGTVREISELRT